MNRHVFLSLATRGTGAASTLLILYVSATLLSPYDFGRFAYLLQALTFAVISAQFGFEIILVGVAGRKNFRVLKKTVYMMLVTSLPVALVSVFLFAAVGGLALSIEEYVCVSVCAYLTVVVRCVASIFLGFERYLTYQVLDQMLRWFPVLAGVCFAGLIAYVLTPDNIVVLIFLVALAFACAQAVFAGIYLDRCYSKCVRPSPPTISLVRLVANKGLAINFPSIAVFSIGVLDQVIVISTLDPSQYGVYRIAIVPVAIFVMLSDVVFISYRRHFMAARLLRDKEAIYRSIITGMRFLALSQCAVGLMSCLVAWRMGFDWSTYLYISGVALVAHSFSWVFGDPFFVLRVENHGVLTAIGIITVGVVMLPVGMFLVKFYDLYGAALYMGLNVSVSRLILYILASRQVKAII